MKVTLPATLESISTLKDGSFKMVFTSQEMPPEHGATLLSMRQKFGWLLFSPNEISVSDIPDIEAPQEGLKSQSVRLRGALYRWFEKEGGSDFDEFYRSKLEKIIQWVKDKL